ncbi:ferrous iron transport protein B [Oscillibacter sp. MSJ-2]|uniref:Ferrous iron transport protein B n=1 Tax=Dysosmobacter acutus TaxID=2841504 RepID=A0ABS6FAB6_9FIRM|nr:ferrous iron transport protein B [Dysosmobacter acutus]MBU5626275.1 ferrous iron transport protein B [Dysosmobacter acutus]
MGLTVGSTGRAAIDTRLRSSGEHEAVFALAGNPNVGKSTVFNALTGMNQHTGNWPGKTVATAQGICQHGEKSYLLVDLPGCYSLLAHSAEEEVARDFLCGGEPDAVIVVCDATCLERNLNLVLQTLEITSKTVVCVNLMDEAKRRNVTVDIEALSAKLGVPVVPAAARSGTGLSELMDVAVSQAKLDGGTARPVIYPPDIEAAVGLLSPALCESSVHPRWAALQMLCGNLTPPDNCPQLEEARTLLQDAYPTPDKLQDAVVSRIVETAERIGRSVVYQREDRRTERDRRLDHILTSRKTGIPVMLALLAGIFWLTITGANYPSSLLSSTLLSFEEPIRSLLHTLGAPTWLSGALVDGIYRTLAWVVSVMLPPMAIFFPLFTLLEDLGYLPRVAFNLDHSFRRCRACGKQALTMAMGFGCNAAGVTGCRIIDSPRERLIAILTNNFVPCNGRFPTLITMLTIFFVGVERQSSLLSALLLTALVLLGVGMTLAASSLLSRTLLRGVPSSFTLELPPYRRPQVGKVIVRSIFDRTLFVLGRAVSVAAPAGLVIWLLSNVSPGGVSLLSRFASALDPAGRFLGLDGVILLAFILGFPANEIVVPIILMAYTAQNTIIEMTDLRSLQVLLTSNGWTWVTALCVMLFSLFHWPCSTTCLTIYQETRSIRWTLLAIALPTVIGIVLCAVLSHLLVLFV